MTQSIDAPSGVAAVALRGFVSFGVLAGVLARLDAALAEDASVRAVVLDLLGIDGFEPGVPARVVHWLAARPQVRAWVLVTTSPVLGATARAAELLVPATEIHVAPTRAEGMNAASRVRGGRPRTVSATGLQNRVSGVPPAPAVERKRTA